MSLGLNDYAEPRMFVSFGQVNEYMKKYYKTANTLKKIQLKCWYYYAEGRFQGGKGALRFSEYKKRMTHLDYLMLVKSYLIDCSDIGGVDRAIEVLTMWYNNVENLSH